MSVHPVETYLKDLGEIYRTGGGVAEESYYGALETLLNEIGKKLKPRVRCVPQLQNIGAGEPDFGLYTADQFQRVNDRQPIAGQKPERGVIECKPWNDDSFARTESTQVSNYWKKYGLVLVTNYRDFVLIGRDDQGKPIRLESFRMAESENAFRGMVAQSHKAAQEHGERLVECLRRTMLHAAPLTDPQELAWFLASFAKEARARVEQTPELPALKGLKKGLEEALGMKFEGEKGQHFFLATLVQTLFYGVFSSWVLWCRENWSRPEAKFQWHDAAWTLHVPMIASLFDQIATPKRLKPLGVDEVLDKAAIVLNRVDRPAFFSKFEQERAVQYFYEPFLKAYDPELRKELGVWYTPPEVVQYQVERVDRALREELNIPDGLADEQVVILDPCCGTGAYLVETLKRIHKTLDEKGRSALTAQKLKMAAIARVFGFELLPAPFVISHLQIGLMLRLLGAPFNLESNERAGVYLTNALTGWEPLEKPKDMLPWPDLQEERDAANRVKCADPILVILGNPPYNAFAGTSPEEEGGLVEPYKGVWYEERPSRNGRPPTRVRHCRLNDPEDRGGCAIMKFNLDDLYIRFFRIAERRIVGGGGGRGIVSFISNFSYLAEQSFVIMRQHLLQEFDKIWLDCMNGDSRETGKTTADGQPDPSVFSTERNRTGIKVGTAICLMVRTQPHSRDSLVRFRHFWGTSKRNDLLKSLTVSNLSYQCEVAHPEARNRYSLKPWCVTKEYLDWPKVTALCLIPPFNGLMEKRNGALFDIDKDQLAARMRTYYDRANGWESLKAASHKLTENAARFKAKDAREKVIAAETYDSLRLCRYAVRPFDTRWCYYSPVRPLWNEPRPGYWEQCWEGNGFFMTRCASAKRDEGVPASFVVGLSDDHFIAPDNACFPIRVRESPKQRKKGDKTIDMFETQVIANLSSVARTYLNSIGIHNPDSERMTAGLIWMHALATTYSPAYLVENPDGIRYDWPRVPLPRRKEVLLASATLGQRVAALLNAEKSVDGITKGRIDVRLREIAIVSKVGQDGLNPDRGHLDITAHWGRMDSGGVCGSCQIL